LSAARVARRKITENTEIDFEGSFLKTEPIKAVRMDEPFEVETLEGTMKGKAGDWLAEGIEGERWPIDADIFKKTYKPAKTAAMVQTDTATLYVLAPEQLRNLITEGQWQMLAEVLWSGVGLGLPNPSKMMDRLIRLHGGAVFFLGRDGMWEVQVPNAKQEYGYINPKGRVGSMVEPFVLDFDAADFVDITFREKLSRPATAEEVQEVLAESGIPFTDDEEWPRNLWVDAIVDAFEVDMEEVLDLPDVDLAELRALWDEYAQNLEDDGDDLLDRFLMRAEQALMELEA
jgi:hypothetical protein